MAGGGSGDHISIEKTLKTQAKVEARKSMQRAKQEKVHNGAQNYLHILNRLNEQWTYILM